MKFEFVSALLSDIERGKMSLPEFQREYVWKKSDIQDFFDSLYRGFPVGGVLLWETDSDLAVHRGDEFQHPGMKTFIVDGQQRLTTLFGIMKGQSPPFFTGAENVFEGLHFDVEKEKFNYREGPFSIDVKALYAKGPDSIYAVTEQLGEHVEKKLIHRRLSRVLALKEVLFHVEVISAERDLEIVVEIFDKVNSRGTPINRADLALAFVSTRWPDVRRAMKEAIDRWQPFRWRNHHLLRCMTVCMTGKVDYAALHAKENDNVDLQKALSDTVKCLDVLLDETQNYLGLDHDYVLRSRNSFPLMIHYLSRWRGFRNGQSEVLRLLSWYVQTIIWRHYASVPESQLQVDINAVTEAKNWDESLKALMHNLRQARGTLEVSPWHFDVSQVNSTYYPFMYLLARATGAKDFGTGERLSRNMNQKLHLHHLFPKNFLKHKYNSRAEVNALANYSFLTSSTNLQISDKSPEDYFPEVENKCPGALDSQWVPKEPDLWKLENYPDFLEERRKLLAKAANNLLNSLERGRLPDA